MKNSDIIGLLLVVGFGLWWAILPNNVIRFYTWFHSRSKWYAAPKPIAVRIIGIIFVAWVLFLYIQAHFHSQR